jgi:hypothetical protein
MYVGNDDRHVCSHCEHFLGHGNMNSSINQYLGKARELWPEEID